MSRSASIHSGPHSVNRNSAGTAAIAVSPLVKMAIYD